MSTLQDRRERSGRDEVLDCLTDGRRRESLSILADREGALRERDLAEAIAAAESDDVTESAVRTVTVELRHLHLPKLDEAGLVAWDPDGETVTAADHPLFEDSRLRQLVEADDPEWDAVLEAVANGRRRSVLAALRSVGGPLQRDALAHAIADGEDGSRPSPETVDDLRVQLHHVHLPKLEAAGLVEYDAAEGTVTYEGHSELPPLDALTPSQA